QVVFAKNREKLVAATRALDRVRLSYAKRSSVYRNSTPHIRVPSTMIRVRSRCIERVRVALSRLAGLLCRQQFAVEGRSVVGSCRMLLVGRIVTPLNRVPDGDVQRCGRKSKIGNAYRMCLRHHFLLCQAATSVSLLFRPAASFLGPHDQGCGNEVQTY